MGLKKAPGHGKGSGVRRSQDPGEAAAEVLTELGGIVDVEEKNGSINLRGFQLPLG